MVWSLILGTIINRNLWLYSFCKMKFWLLSGFSCCLGKDEIWQQRNILLFCIFLCQVGKLFREKYNQMPVISHLIPLVSPHFIPTFQVLSHILPPHETFSHSLGWDWSLPDLTSRGAHCYVLGVWVCPMFHFVSNVCSLLTTQGYLHKKGGTGFRERYFRVSPF